MGGARRIITDGQSPQNMDTFHPVGLCDADKIRIEDRHDILGDIKGALLTFNSLMIEAAIWRIPSLPERYIQMNDDFAIINSVTSTEFFGVEGPVVRCHFVPFDNRRPKIILR